MAPLMLCPTMTISGGGSAAGPPNSAPHSATTSPASVAALKSLSLPAIVRPCPRRSGATTWQLQWSGAIVGDHRAPANLRQAKMCGGSANYHPEPDLITMTLPVLQLRCNQGPGDPRVPCPVEAHYHWPPAARAVHVEHCISIRALNLVTGVKE